MRKVASSRYSDSSGGSQKERRKNKRQYSSFRPVSGVTNGLSTLGSHGYQVIKNFVQYFQFEERMTAV